MNEYMDKKSSNCIYYHSLCELSKNYQEDGQNKILRRENIKLLTYNIFLRPPPIKNNENDWKDERLIDFCDNLEKFDIICLQEMFGSFNSRKQSLIRNATKAGFFFYVDSSSPTFVSKYMVDGGLLILSRFPIVSFSFCPYRYGVIADSLAQKGLLYAKIMIKDTFLFLFSTHLQASYFDSGERHFIVSCETRMDQISQINKMIAGVLKDENYSPKDKILLVGDFNVDAHSYAFKRPECLSSGYENFIQSEYQRMIDNLNGNKIVCRNTFHHYKNTHPVTYGDGEKENGFKETCLTHVEDLGSQQTLDYIFECYLAGEDETAKSLVLNPDALQVEMFLINEIDKQKLKEGQVIKKYTQLSDHYGLSCELVYSQKKNKSSDEIITIDIDLKNNHEETNKLLDNI